MPVADQAIGSESLYVGRQEAHTLLPDPVPTQFVVPIVSADDHLVEPGSMLVDRVPKRFVDAVPRVITGADGLEYWTFEDGLYANRTLGTSVVGRPVGEWVNEPVLFAEMRPASYDARLRLVDMDLAGIWASLGFPSAPFGFAGQRFHRMADPGAGLACLRAYNDWVIDEWVATEPDRLIAQQIPWLPDPVVAAGEIRSNAARGFKAVTFSENPEALGYPSLYTDHWEPFFVACSETGTVVNLHIGSSSRKTVPSSDSPAPVRNALFPMNAMMASVDWIFAGIPVRHPELKIVLSESGLSWVPMIMERLRRVGRWNTLGTDETPEEVLLRAFHFCSIYDPTGIVHRHEIGIDRIMLEVDYPHPDTSWPDTQSTLGEALKNVPGDEQAQLAYRNACRVYRHPEPPAPWVAARQAEVGRAAPIAPQDARS